MASQHKLFQIFKTGTHTSMGGSILNFSERDLSLMATCYRPECKKAPLVLGHPADDQPELGEVTGLFARDDALYAQAAVSPNLVDLVRTGRYKHVSASFFTPSHPGNPTPGAYYLRHVGFLGAHPPAVKGMAPLAFSENSGCIAFSDACDLQGKFGTNGSFTAPRGYQIAPDRAALHAMAEDYPVCTGQSLTERQPWRLSWLILKNWFHKSRARLANCWGKLPRLIIKSLLLRISAPS